MDESVLLSAIPPAEHDKLIPLLNDGPALVERLTGEPIKASTLARYARLGLHGVKLKTIRVRRRIMTTPRLLVDFWFAVAGEEV